MNRRVTLTDDEVQLIIKFCESDMDQASGSGFDWRSRQAYRYLLGKLKTKLATPELVEGEAK